jgi:hypothetical protein
VIPGAQIGALGAYPDDLVAGLGKRDQDASAAASQLEDRSTLGIGQPGVKRQIVGERESVVQAGKVGVVPGWSTNMEPFPIGMAADRSRSILAGMCASRALTLGPRPVTDDNAAPDDEPKAMSSAS